MSQSLLPIAVVVAVALALALARSHVTPEPSARRAMPDGVGPSQGPGATMAPGGAVASARVRSPRPPRPMPVPIHAFTPSLGAGSHVTRAMLTNIAAVLAISDVLHGWPDASDDELIRAATEGSGLPAGTIVEMLQGYPRTSRTLPGIYEAAGHLPEVRAVQEAYARAEVRWDPQADCLLDGLRFAAAMTHLVDFLDDSLPRGIPGEDGLPPAWAGEMARVEQEKTEARAVLVHAFRERFLHRHGLPPGQAEALLAGLASLRVSRLGPEDLNVPRPNP